MKIFVSYRRSDSQDIAARIADRLNDLPGVRKVFIDVDGIEPGVNFAARIDQALASSDVCLILIGNDWTGAEAAGGPARILDPEDFVRREAAASLASGNKVIPVLLNGAPMPSVDALPEDVGALTHLNAVFVRHTSFNQDLELLEDAIFSRRPRSRVTRFFRRRPILTGALKSIGGVLAAGALLVVLAALHSELSGGRALDESLGSKGVVWLLILTVLALGAALPLVLRRKH